MTEGAEHRSIEQTSLQRPADCVVVLVDMQGRLASLIDQSAERLRQQRLLLQGAANYGVPVLWLEQLPEKLGDTVSELRTLLDPADRIVKDSFSCWGAESFRTRLQTLGRTQVILCGIECHVCVYQSCMQLLQNGYGVQVVEEATGSCRPEDRSIGLYRMRAAGALPTTVEMLLFEWQGRATGPRFKALTQLLKAARTD